jgi:hypothetical protein
MILYDETIPGDFKAALDITGREPALRCNLCYLTAVYHSFKTGSCISGITKGARSLDEAYDMVSADERPKKHFANELIRTRNRYPNVSGTTEGTLWEHVTACVTCPCSVRGLRILGNVCLLTRGEAIKAECLTCKESKIIPPLFGAVKEEAPAEKKIICARDDCSRAARDKRRYCSDTCWQEDAANKYAHESLNASLKEKCKVGIKNVPEYKGMLIYCEGSW